MIQTESDVVFVKGLKVMAVIGVYDWERAINQPLLIDIALETDIKAAAASDEVADALNYKAVCDDVSRWCKETQAKLLEHLAEIIADNLLTQFSCHKVTLSLAKPTAIDQADAVGVQITRYSKVSGLSKRSGHSEHPENSEKSNAEIDDGKL